MSTSSYRNARSHAYMAKCSGPSQFLASTARSFVDGPSSVDNINDNTAPYTDNLFLNLQRYHDTNNVSPTSDKSHNQSSPHKVPPSQDRCQYIHGNSHSGKVAGKNNTSVPKELLNMVSPRRQERLNTSYKILRTIFGPILRFYLYRSRRKAQRLQYHPTSSHNRAAAKVAKQDYYNTIDELKREKMRGNDVSQRLAKLKANPPITPPSYKKGYIVSCIKNCNSKSLLASWPVEVLSYLLKDAHLRYCHSGQCSSSPLNNIVTHKREIILYRGEPASCTGILLVLSGSVAIIKQQCDGRKVLKAPPAKVIVMKGPIMLSDDYVFTDTASPYLMVAVGPDDTTESVTAEFTEKWSSFSKNNTTSSECITTFSNTPTTSFVDCVLINTSHFWRTFSTVLSPIDRDQMRKSITSRRMKLLKHYIANEREKEENILTELSSLSSSGINEPLDAASYATYNDSLASALISQSWILRALIGVSDHSGDVPQVGEDLDSLALSAAGGGFVKVNSDFETQKNSSCSSIESSLNFYKYSEVFNDSLSDYETAQCLSLPAGTSQQAGLLPLIHSRRALAYFRSQLLSRIEPAVYFPNDEVIGEEAIAPILFFVHKGMFKMTIRKRSTYLCPSNSTSSITSPTKAGIASKKEVSDETSMYGAIRDDLLLAIPLMGDETSTDAEATVYLGPGQCIGESSFLFSERRPYILSTPGASPEPSSVADGEHDAIATTKELVKDEIKIGVTECFILRQQCFEELMTMLHSFIKDQIHNEAVMKSSNRSLSSISAFMPDMKGCPVNQKRTSIVESLFHESISRNDSVTITETIFPQTKNSAVIDAKTVGNMAIRVLEAAKLRVLSAGVCSRYAARFFRPVLRGNTSSMSLTHLLPLLRTSVWSHISTTYLTDPIPSMIEFASSPLAAAFLKIVNTVNGSASTAYIQEMVMSACDTFLLGILRCAVPCIFPPGSHLQVVCPSFCERNETNSQIKTCVSPTETGSRDISPFLQSRASNSVSRETDGWFYKSNSADYPESHVVEAIGWVLGGTGRSTRVIDDNCGLLQLTEGSFFDVVSSSGLGVSHYPGFTALSTMDVLYISVASLNASLSSTLEEITAHMETTGPSRQHGSGSDFTSGVHTFDKDDQMKFRMSTEKMLDLPLKVFSSYMQSSLAAKDSYSYLMNVPAVPYLQGAGTMRSGTTAHLTFMEAWFKHSIFATMSLSTAEVFCTEPGRRPPSQSSTFTSLPASVTKAEIAIRDSRRNLILGMIPSFCSAATTTEGIGKRMSTCEQMGDFSKTTSDVRRDPSTQRFTPINFYVKYSTQGRWQFLTPLLNYLDYHSATVKAKPSIYQLSGKDRSIDPSPYSLDVSNAARTVVLSILASVSSVSSRSRHQPDIDTNRFPLAILQLHRIPSILSSTCENFDIKTTFCAICPNTMRLQGAAILATSPSACTFLGAVMTFYNNFGDSYTSADRPRTSNEPPSDSVSRIEPKKPSRSSPIDSQGHRSRGATTKLASSTNTSNSTGSSSTPNSTFGNNMSSSINYEGSSNITRSAVQPRARRPLIGRKGPVTAGPITRFSRDYCAYNSGNNFGAIPTPPTVVNLSSTTSMIPSASLLEIVANLPVKFDESSNDLKVTCKKVTDCGSGILHESVYSNNTDSLARRTLPSVQEPKEADRHIFNRSSERDSHRLGSKMFDHGRKNSLGPLDKSKDVYKANPVNHYHSLVTKCFGLTQNHQNFLAKNRDALSRTRLSGLQCISDREESNQVENQDILSESTLQSSLDRSEIASACSTQPRSISLCFQTPSAVPLESQAIWTFEDDKDEVDMMLRSYESVDFREKATKSYQENKDRKVNSSCIEREKEENELPHNTRKRSSYSFLLPSVSRPVTSATSRRAYTNSNVQNNSSQHFGLTQSKTGCEVLFLLHVMSVEISENSVSNLIVNGENNSNNQRQPIGKAIVCKVFRDYSHDLDSDIRLDFTGPFEKLSFGEIPSRCLSLATPPIAISDATKCQPSSQFNAAKYNFSWSTTATSYIFKLQKPFLTTGNDIEFTPSPQYPSIAWFEFQISCVKAEEGGDVTGSKGSGMDSSDLHQSQLTFGKYNPKDPKDGDSTDKNSEINTDIFIGSAFVNFDALVTQSGTIKLPLYSRNKSHNGGFPMSSELDKCGRTTTSCGGSLDDSVDTPIGTVSCSILVTVNEEECQKGIENFPTQVDSREAPVSENRNDVTDSIFVEIENPILESQEFLFPEAHTKYYNIVSSDSSISFRKQCVNTPPPQPNSGSFFRLRATTEAYVFTSTATPSSFFFSLYIMPLSSEMPSSFDVFKITLPTAEKPLLVNIREVTLQLLPPKREFSVSGIQCFRPDVVRLSYSLLNVLPPHTKVHRFFIAIVNCLNLPNLDAMGDPGNAYIRVRVVDANTEAKKSLKASIANVRCSTIFQTKTVLATKDPYFWGSTERPIEAASGTVADGGACFIIELTDSDVSDFIHLEHPTQGENQMPDGKNKKVSPIPSLQFEVWDEEGGSDVIGESRATTCTSPISVLGTEGHTTNDERDSPCDMDTDSDLLDTTLINHLGIVRVSLADVIGIFHMPNGEFDKGKGSTYQLPLSLVTTPNFESNYTAGNTKCDMEEGEDTGGTTHHGTFLCSLTNSVTPRADSTDVTNNGAGMNLVLGMLD